VIFGVSFINGTTALLLCSFSNQNSNLKGFIMKNTMSVILPLFVAIFICGLLSTSDSSPFGNKTHENVSNPSGAEKLVLFHADGGNEIDSATLVVEDSSGEQREIIASNGQPFLTGPEYHHRPQYILEEGEWLKVTEVKEYGRSLCDEISACDEQVAVAEPEPEPKPQPTVIEAEPCVDEVVEYKKCSKTTKIISGGSDQILVYASVSPMHPTSVMGGNPDQEFDEAEYTLHSPTSVANGD